MQQHFPSGIYIQFSVRLSAVLQKQSQVAVIYPFHISQATLLSVLNLRRQNQSHQKQQLLIQTELWDAVNERRGGWAGQGRKVCTLLWAAILYTLHIGRSNESLHYCTSWDCRRPFSAKCDFHNRDSATFPNQSVLRCPQIIDQASKCVGIYKHQEQVAMAETEAAQGSKRRERGGGQLGRQQTLEALLLHFCAIPRLPL